MIRDGASEIRAEGLFSLGYPRRDGGEEINARFRVEKRDLDGLRHAFELDDWPVSGRLSGEFHLTGDYQRPIGFGAMTINDGVAYGEPFQTGTAALRFDGEGVRLDAASITKTTGTIPVPRSSDGTARIPSMPTDGEFRPKASPPSRFPRRRRRAPSNSPPRAAARSTTRATTSGSGSMNCRSARNRWAW